MSSPPGRAFAADCSRLGLHIEYELHAMGELLPRELFQSGAELFRMDENGRRTPDGNLCVHSTRALQIVATNALRLVARLRPTTSRYFFWGDDGRPWCRCPDCRGFSDSDQALLLENHLIRELRKVDPTAELAHLAYANTLPCPQRVRPEPGVFLEFAPIERRYDIPFARRTGLSELENNLQVFPAATAQVLEYWLDVSRFSRWKRPAVKLPWRPDVLAADLQSYSELGVLDVTTFAVWIDAEYRKTFGDPVAIQDYGDAFTRRALKARDEVD